MKKLITLRISGLTFILFILLAQVSRAQVFPCSLQTAISSLPGSPQTFSLYAYLSGDSACSNYNPQYIWTIYGNPNITISGQQASYTFSSPGYYMVCVQANFQGMTTSACDTIVIQGGLNCTPEFVVSTQGLNASFNLSGSIPNGCFDGTTLYSWNFGDGTVGSGTGNAGIDHSFASAGTYNVCLTATNANGQAFNYCAAVTITGQGIFSIGGMVLAEGSCLQEPVLVEIYGIGNSFYESMTVNGGPDSCFYYFQTPLTAQPMQYIIRATPMTNPDYLSTYFGDVAFWGNASLISPVQNTWNYHINLIPAASDTALASGTVSGNISGNGITVNSVFNGNPISTVFNVTSCRVLVYNSSNQPVGFAIVNSNGNYNISGLPDGNYSLRIDNPKVPAISVPFSIGSGLPAASLNFAAGVSGINQVTALVKTEYSGESELWPNPAGSRLSFRSKSGNFSILNAHGQVVLTGESQDQVDISVLPSGVYQVFFQEQTGTTRAARFVKL